MKDYIGDILGNLKLSLHVQIHAMIYIDRVVENGSVKLNILTLHRLVLVALVIASIYLKQDVSRTTFAHIGRVRLSELMNAEAQLFTSLKGELFVEDEEFEIYMDALTRRGETSNLQSIERMCTA
eukprot:CAMPEP_0167761046 /NCGR_PEP_ID=MMETSP0110_2-20121227/11934_1 /TAXON_ID=629695 /ORGANISM="Gymnochlora sp., Strain CCMP2014" /LENGTH=124 /DNA_ID=CAMNT_0007647645 /DNA_START=209 /DNA_END=583 /DNA_ORIENTATION=+